MSTISPLGPVSLPEGAVPAEPQRRPRWQLHAACRELPTDLFFPVGHGERAEAQVARAKEVCRRCQVRDACLEFAMVANMRYGVFGGLSEDERKELRRGDGPVFPASGPLARRP